jgi:hypothetical protein
LLRPRRDPARGAPAQQARELQRRKQGDREGEQLYERDRAVPADAATREFLERAERP